MDVTITPKLQHRLLLAVGDAVANDGFEETLQLSAGVVRELRASTARTNREFENHMAAGCEARSFARSVGPKLTAIEEDLVQLRLLLARAVDISAESLVAELRLLEEETEAFRVRLSEALSVATRPPTPIDLDRLKKESDADFAAGRFKRLETLEEFLKGLGNGN